jgi:DNA polymerase sigma
MQIRRKILDIIHGIYSDAELFVVGSTINGCGSKDADMDLCCTVERYDAFMNERT